MLWYSGVIVPFVRIKRTLQPFSLSRNLASLVTGIAVNVTYLGAMWINRWPGDVEIVKLVFDVLHECKISGGINPNCDCTDVYIYIYIFIYIYLYIYLYIMALWLLTSHVPYMII